MIEVYTPRVPQAPGRCFYTIRHEDIGKAVIATTAGSIHVVGVMGRVMGIDVGKRVYFTPKDGYPGGGFWTPESNDQRDRRSAAERDRP